MYSESSLGLVDLNVRHSYYCFVCMVFVCQPHCPQFSSLFPTAQPENEREEAG